MKIRFKKMLPVIMIIVITILVSCVAYCKVIEKEKARCWGLLSDSAESVNKEIQIRIEDNISILRLVANAMVQENRINSYESIVEHLNDFQKMTIFSRIDVLYPDNMILIQNGEKKDVSSEISFQEIADKGAHMSNRMTDFETQKEVVTYYMPIVEENETKGILCGVIECDELPDIFTPYIYNGKAIACIVDSSDGSFIMDDWHDTLGNIFDMAQRKNMKGYEDVDLKSDVKSQKTGVVAYKSKQNGKNSYMYYTPTGVFDWELLIIIQEDVAFSSLIELQETMIQVGIVEGLLLFIYFIGNLISTNNLLKSREQTKFELKRSNTLIECVKQLSFDHDMDRAINNLLEIVKQYFEADRTYIFEFDYEKQIACNSYEQVSEGVTREIDNLQAVPLEVIRFWIERFKTDGTFYVENVMEENKKNPSVCYDMLEEQSINSLIAVPLLRENEIIGLMGVDNPRTNCKDFTLLSSIQFFITSSMDTKMRQERLHYLGYNDSLSKLYNRNNYIKVIESYKGKKLSKIGILYMDLNGLKQINDKLGHEAGDEYIKTAATVMREVFPENAYRIGGDEFVVMLKETEEKIFNEKVALFKQKAKENQVSVSCGILWKESCEDLEKTLKEADQLMYFDKEAYYTENKIDRRRN